MCKVSIPLTQDVLKIHFVKRGGTPVIRINSISGNVNIVSVE